MGGAIKQSHSKVMDFVENKKTRMAVYAMMHDKEVILKYANGGSFKTKLCGISIQAGYKSVNGAWYTIFVGFADVNDWHKWKQSEDKQLSLLPTYSDGVQVMVDEWQCPICNCYHHPNQRIVADARSMSPEEFACMYRQWPYDYSRMHDAIKAAQCRDREKAEQEKAREQAFMLAVAVMDGLVEKYGYKNKFFKYMGAKKRDDATWNDITKAYYKVSGIDLYELANKHNMSRRDVVVKLNYVATIRMLLRKMIKELHA